MPEPTAGQRRATPNRKSRSLFHQRLIYRYLLLAGLGLLLLPTPAQDLPMLGRDLVLSAAITADAGRRAKEMGVSLDKSGRKTTTRPAARLSYTATPALRQQTVDNLARRMTPKSASQAQAMRTLFGPGGQADYTRLYATGPRGSGFQDHDAASALASFMEAAYVVVNDLRDTRSITPAVDRGLRTQMAGLLSQHAAARNPAQLASLGEEMKLQTVIMMAGWQDSQKSGQTAAQSFRSQFGLDLTQVRLTENGLVPKPAPSQPTGRRPNEPGTRRIEPR